MVFWKKKKPELPTRAPEEQSHLDQELITHMREIGGDLEKDRKVDHMAMFLDAQKATDFIKYLEDNAYDIDGKSYLDEEKVYIVQFSKVSSPTNMQLISLEILQKTTEFSGSYDGWGCQIAD